MSDIHTVIFILDSTEIPIEKALIPESARTLQIFCDPEKYGWRSTKHTDQICRMDMRGFELRTRDILNFIQIKNILRPYFMSFSSKTQLFCT